MPPRPNRHSVQKALVDFQAAAVIPAIVRRLCPPICGASRAAGPLQRVDVARPRRGVQRIHVVLDQLDDGRMAIALAMANGVVPCKSALSTAAPFSSNRRAVST